jgi:UDP-2,4-diacetamido-2,4,6-trideoxy-beta-L-altropyranose hydrolase
MNSFKSTDYFVIRADSSQNIGLGHVLRCLAFAEWAVKDNLKAILLTKSSNSFINERILRLGGEVIILPSGSGVFTSSYAHSHWLDTSEEDDGKFCIDEIKKIIKKYNYIKPKFIIVDHYALGAPWEKTLSQVSPILVVDDLSDRQHDCRWLVDQTYGKSVKDYYNLVPCETKLFIGPKYALIRKEFTDAKNTFRRTFPKSKSKVLITLGGIDKRNDTSKILTFLDAYKQVQKKEIVITVVTSNSNPNLNDLKSTIHQMTDVTLLIDVNNMAELMATHDVCIGAAGSTSWERCVMSLPTISIVLAENQKTIAKNLADAEVVLDLGLMADITQDKFMETFYLLIHDMNLYNSLSIKSKSLCDGLGCNRIMKEVVG